MTLRSALLAGIPVVIVGCSLTASLDDLTAGGAAGAAGAAGGTTAAGAAGAKAGGAGNSGAAAGAAGAAAKSGAAGAAAGAAGGAGMAGAGAGSAGAPGGAGGSTVAGAAGTAGAAGGAASEICTNGKDDDGDGKIDCADPDCSTVACVASAPTGWSGPFVFYVGVKGSEPPCAGAFTDALVPPTSAPAATCSACSCAPPTGGACLIATVTAFASPGCGGAQQDQQLGTPGQCFPIQNSVGNDVFRTKPVEAQGATCAPSGGAATLPPLSASSARLCFGAPGMGCSAGEVCAPKAQAPWKNGSCIQKTGDVACGVPGFPNKTLVTTQLDDTRGCTPCACDFATGRTCPSTTKFFNTLFCSGQLATGQHDGACVPAGGTDGFIWELNGPPQGGTCAPLGGAPTGNVQPNAVSTVCCAG